MELDRQILNEYCSLLIYIFLPIRMVSGWILERFKFLFDVNKCEGRVSNLTPFSFCKLIITTVYLVTSALWLYGHVNSLPPSSNILLDDHKTFIKTFSPVRRDINHHIWVSFANNLDHKSIIPTSSLILTASVWGHL